MPARNQGKGKLTLAMPIDILEFVKRHGGARRTDLAVGKVNTSEEVADFLHRLMAKVSPESVGHALAREKEELRLRMEQIDHEAQELFGVATIEEFLAREASKGRAEADVVKAQIAIRREVQDEKLGELQQAWDVRHRGGTTYDRRHEVSWAKSRERELRTLGMTPEEFVRRMARSKDRSPEVA